MDDRYEDRREDGLSQVPESYNDLYIDHDYDEDRRYNDEERVADRLMLSNALSIRVDEHLPFAINESFHEVDYELSGSDYELGMGSSKSNHGSVISILSRDRSISMDRDDRFDRVPANAVIEYGFLESDANERGEEGEGYDGNIWLDSDDDDP